MALWWLSFLRAPPFSAASGSRVQIIIQIADDLRTTLYPETIDIYFIWSSSSLDHSTNPAKLTTWRPEHAHKLLSVNSPPVVSRIGASASSVTWRLGLFAVSPDMRPSNDMIYVHLTQRHSLNAILPVLSALIAFSPSPTPSQVTSKRGKARSATAIQKQDEIQRVYHLPLFPAVAREDPPIERRDDPGAFNPVIITEKTSFDLDKRAWDSGVVLSAILSWWLSGHLLQSQPNAHSPVLAHNHAQIQQTLSVIARPGCTILELGAGCGVVSVILATLLNRLHASGSVFQPNLSQTPSSNPTQIHATDLWSAIPLITCNIQANCRLSAPLHETSEEIHAPTVEVTASSLDWEDEMLPALVYSYPPDVIIMSDVTYNTASFPALLRTLKKLLSLSPAARVIIAYKERHAAERTAWEMFESDARLSLHKVEEIPGPAGAPVEIWLGTQRA